MSTHTARSTCTRIFHFLRQCSPLIASVVPLSLAGACKTNPVVQGGIDHSGITYVKLDNPDIHQPGVVIKRAQTADGAMERTIDVSEGQVRVGYGDFLLVTNGGDGTADPNSHMTKAGAVGGEQIPARPPEDGHYSSDSRPGNVIALESQGLRIGYVPMSVKVQPVEANLPWPAPLMEKKIALDPSVALVPIEAVVVYHEPDVSDMYQQRLSAQLELWDHFAIDSKMTETNPGYIRMTTHDAQWLPRDAQGRYNVQTQTAPDTIWSACGVQFRLVNYFELQVPARNVLPVIGDANADPDKYWPQGTADRTPLDNNHSRVTQDPRHMEGVITVIFSKRVSFPDAEETGQYLIGEDALGVSLIDGRDGGAVLAHELGHASGLDDPSQGDPKFNVMIQVGPGYDPTSTECAAMKQWAEKFSTSFWGQIARKLPPNGNDKEIDPLHR